MSPTGQMITALIAKFTHPATGKSLTESISKIIIRNGEVIFAIYTEGGNIAELEQTRQTCQKTILGLEEVSKVSITLTPRTGSLQAPDKKIAGVKKIIIVASGKGGVGKSTIAFNLAISLANTGLKAGLADTDVYGPSLPKLAGINKKPVLEDNIMIPHEKFGIKLMSVGFLVDEKAAAIWRGPMASKVLYQLMRMTKWQDKDKPLDVLVVDTPPGTGDIHLSLAENYHIDGAVIVTTPQALATADAAKGIDMYMKLNIPVLGVVGNMSYFASPATGEKHYVFGKDVGETLAKEFRLEMLAELPIDPELSTTSDKGRPVCYYHPKENTARLFEAMAAKIYEKIE